MKKIIIGFIVALTIPALAFAVSSDFAVFGAGGGIDTLDQWTSTTTPYGASIPAITQRRYGKPLLLTGLTAGKCVEIASNGLATTSSSACGSGSSITGGTAGMLTSWLTSSTLTATSSPTVRYIFATSTTATSTFLGGLDVGNNTGFSVSAGAPAGSLKVTTAGNVGIGTTTPRAKLDISVSGVDNPVSSSALNGKMVIGRGDVADAGMLEVGTYGGSYAWLQNRNYGTLSTYYPLSLNPLGGNVGIGTTTPNNNLNIWNTVNGNGLTLESATNLVPMIKMMSGGTAAGNRNWGITEDYDVAGDFTIRQSNALGGDPWSAGTTRMVINSSGNVGIGTTSPAQKLHVFGATPQVEIDSSAGTNPSLYLTTVNDTTQGIKFSYDQGPGAGYIDNVWNNASGALYFRLRTLGTPVDVLSLKASGNVGIGTTGPTQKLSVNGSALLSTNSSLYIGDDNGDGTGYVYLRDSSDYAEHGSYWGHKFTTATYGEVMRISRIGGLSLGSSYVATDPGAGNMIISGNVGIGTTTPNSQLHVAGTGVLTLGNAGVTNGYINTADAMHFNIDSDNNDTGQSFIFATNRTSSSGGTELMRILESGNVGIGTTTPIGKLHVSSGAAATTTVNFGEYGSATSHACFNTKNTSGADISFYFVGTTQVIENNACR